MSQEARLEPSDILTPEQLATRLQLPLSWVYKKSAPEDGRGQTPRKKDLTSLYGLVHSMSMEAIPIKPVKCQRCGHEWYPRAPKLPKFCANCNSPYWNIPRRKPGKKAK